MGLILLLGILIILYLLDKVLMVITANIMAIYIIVRKVKKKKVGKIIILPIVILIVLGALSLPGDFIAVVTTVDANVEATKYRSELKTKDYALVEDTEPETFIYHDNKYVDITDDLTNLIGDGRHYNYMYRSDNFEVLVPLVKEEKIQSGFKWFSFDPDESTVYKPKGSPDDKILFADYSGKVWCLEEEAENAKQTYNNKENYDYYIIYTVNDVEKQQKISLSVYNEILECKQKEDGYALAYFTATIVDKEKVELCAKSHDGRVIHEYICEDLVMQNGELYYYYASGRGRYLNVVLQ